MKLPPFVEKSRRGMVMMVGAGNSSMDLMLMEQKIMTRPATSYLFSTASSPGRSRKRCSRLDVALLSASIPLSTKERKSRAMRMALSLTRTVDGSTTLLCESLSVNGERSQSVE